jgi:CO/xanthine dehydrogenase FAD-binding subunit
MPVEPPVATPCDLHEAYRLMASDRWQPIAGGTDLMVQITGELGEPPDRVIDLWRLDELRGIRLEHDGDLDVLSRGALTTYAQIRSSALIAERLPSLVEAAATVGAAQIQNRGTIGGNIANASPAGDTLPVFLAADARIELGSHRGQREVDASAFWTGYRTTERQPHELVTRVRVPLPAGRTIRFRKVGTRRAQAISKVVLALAWRAEAEGCWRDVRLGMGSVAATPIRARRTEAVLEGGEAGPVLAQRAAASLAAEIHPIDDVRSTADYRRAVASRLLYRLVTEAM